jgi:hypothetical protein
MILAIQHALAGLAANRQQFESAASEVAQVGRPLTEANRTSPPSPPATQWANLLAARRGLSANLNSLAISDRLLGVLVDFRA